MITKRMKHCVCPECEKQLIRLEPFEEGIYNYWCDSCNIDITITDNDAVEKEEVDDNDENDSH